MVMWIMLNPSTADDVENDPTINRCIDFSKRWGYDGLVVGNVYAYRSTDPRGLWLSDDPVGPDNYKHLYHMASKASLVVAGWGGKAINTDARHALSSLPSDKSVNCLVINKDGSPKHPLYVRGDQPLIPYQMIGAA